MQSRSRLTIPAIGLAIVMLLLSFGSGWVGGSIAGNSIPSVQGAAGPPGADGHDGADGRNGADGVAGLSVVGPRGPAGSVGPAGAAGADGAPGDMGPSGVPGPTGAPGAPGADGLDATAFNYSTMDVFNGPPVAAQGMIVLSLATNEMTSPTVTRLEPGAGSVFQIEAPGYYRLSYTINVAGKAPIVFPFYEIRAELTRVSPPLLLSRTGYLPGSTGSSALLRDTVTVFLNSGERLNLALGGVDEAEIGSYVAVLTIEKIR